MRLIDIDAIKSKATIYETEAGKLVRYDNYEEFRIHEPDAKVIESYIDLIIMIRDESINLEYKVESTSNIIYVADKNVWVKTNDKFVPDYADNNIEVTYQTDSQGNPIPTDGCYVKLIGLLSLTLKIVLYLSTGLAEVNVKQWNVTGAVRTQFKAPKTVPTRGAGSYQAALKRILGRRYPDANMYKFLFAFLHPSSPGFMDMRRSRKLGFNNKIRVEDIDKIFLTPSFRIAMTQVIKMLMPELKQEVKKQFTPEQLVGILVQAAEKAGGDKGSVKELMEVFDKIKSIGYEEDVTIEDTRVMLPDANLLSNSSFGKPPEVKPLQVQEYDATEEILNTPTPNFTSEELEELRDDLGGVEGFTMDDEEDD
jgi:hypothetical protein